ncbi:MULTISPECIES: PBSX family phage terminase large subunit [Lysinibacillus]|uniref:PBSX family phage terminase large subunit n=1 Tax=Lysinibacillus TaxID=400634 RepID=UPI00214D05CE|nr:MULTISPECIES: PBSX family phage terminase large subunit [Lysinibacillus]UUV26089.1 PBSX family phage terminase large subunit [Lysinibacillus sp. FN11]UYB48962.1 PBSX family phage terminase large subunit [Lysinibacillus capsici]
MSKAKRISIQKLIGKGYADYWNFKGRYRVCKGSRASKKSKTTAIYFITQIMKHPAANLLVIRKTYRTLKDSCFAELQWAITQLDVEKYWQVKESPLELTYLPTGQKIYFRGLDDPLKVTSITVKTGVLCWMWIEEAYELLNEDDFNMLDESIRGSAPGHLFKQITLTLNPWNERHWIKKRFFDAKRDDDILAKSTNYLCNEFLDDADKRVFERMKRDNPRRYQVAGLGNWGIVDGLVFENWIESAFDKDKLIKDRPRIKAMFGLDFGYTNDPTAFFAALVDETAKEIYVFDEIYQTGMSNSMIFEEVKRKGYIKERIRADSAEPKSIDDLYNMGMYNIKKARKGPDSINNGIQTIQDYKIIIHPSCVNFLTEITNYTWDQDKFGKKLNKPVDDFNHLMDAMRYALEELKGDLFSFD